MSQITIFSTSWCADCRNTKAFLDRNGIAYREVDVDVEESASRQIIEWSKGRRVVPTLHIQKGCYSADDLVLHNPSLKELSALILNTN